MATVAFLNQAYLAYFGRPIDFDGKLAWGPASGATNAQVEAGFAASAESKALYGDKGVNLAYINAVYNNLFNHDADAAGAAYWLNLIAIGRITAAGAAMQILNNGVGGDAVIAQNKQLATQAFSDAMDTTQENLGFANGVQAARDYIKTIGAAAPTPAQTDAAVLAVTSNTGVIGTAFTLTTGVDAFVGTANNDTFNGTLNAASTVNSFDNINGGAGTDTLNIASTTGAAFALPAALTFANLEIVNVSNAGTAGTNAVTVTDTTFGTGVQKLNWLEAGAGSTAAVAVTLNSATDVSVISKGVAFTNIAITDKSTTAASTGSTLKTVTIESATGNAVLTGNAITTVNMTAIGTSTTVTAAAGTRALTINAAGTTTQGGLTDATATTATLNVTGAQTFGTLTVAKAGTVTINTNAAATTAVVAATATTLNLGGTGLNTLTAGAGNALLTSVVISGAGGVAADLSAIATLTSVDTTASTAAAPATGVLTGANTLTLGTGTAFTGGAGQDVITVGATTKAIALGAGNDTAVVSVTALGSGGSVTGGDGTDILKLTNGDAVTLSTAGAAQTAFKAAVTGFETLDVGAQSGSTIAVNAVGTFSTIKLLSATQAQIFSGVVSGQTIDDTYNAAGTSITTNALTDANDSLSLILRGDLSGGARVFGSLVAPGVETVNITTVDNAATFVAQLATITLTDANATTIKLSGNNGIALTHAGTALTSLDASGLTKGAVTFTSDALTTNAVVTGSLTGDDTLNFAASVAKVTITETAGTNSLTGSATIGSTINGGSGIDTITGGAGIDTISAGAGSTTNSITGAAGADLITLTGSLGADTVAYGANATAAIATAANVDTITNFATGIDKINLTVSAGTAGTSTLNVIGANTTTAAALGTVVTDATSVADIAAVYTQLAIDLLNATNAFAASATGAAGIVAREVTFTNGAAAGTYLVINDGQASFQAATDVVLKLVGTTVVAAGDFAYTYVA